MFGAVRTGSGAALAVRPEESEGLEQGGVAPCSIGQELSKAGSVAQHALLTSQPCHRPATAPATALLPPLPPPCYRPCYRPAPPAAALPPPCHRTATALLQPCSSEAWPHSSRSDAPRRRRTRACTTPRAWEGSGVSSASRTWGGGQGGWDRFGRPCAVGAAQAAPHSRHEGCPPFALATAAARRATARQGERSRARARRQSAAHRRRPPASSARHRHVTRHGTEGFTRCIARCITRTRIAPASTRTAPRSKQRRRAARPPRPPRPPRPGRTGRSELRLDRRSAARAPRARQAAARLAPPPGAPCSPLRRPRC